MYSKSLETKCWQQERRDDHSLCSKMTKHQVEDLYKDQIRKVHAEKECNSVEIRSYTFPFLLFIM